MQLIPQPPGWYPDPDPAAPPGRHRYWTGRLWTGNVANADTSSGSGGRKRRQWVPFAVLGLVVVLIAVTAGYFGTRSSKSYPAAWDPQVAPIAEQVSALRGLSFEHAVPVRYLTDQEFRKQVAVESSSLSPAARRRVKNLEGTLRAFGLIAADTDLVKSFSAANEAGIVAFYDPDAEEVVVRGEGPLDIDRKATLAHELTHVMQDQHFDLNELRAAAADSDTASAGALTALVEGDAERIKEAYVGHLPDADRDAFDALESERSSSSQAELSAIPDVVRISLGAPYAFGPDILEVITADGGNGAVDDALDRPPPTDEIFLDPGAALEEPEVVTVPKPSLEPGERQLGSADQLGPFDLYTVLASRLDRQVALDASDTWAGDRTVTYRTAGHVCVKDTVEATTTEGAATLADAFEAWAATKDGSSVATDPEHRRSTLTACDTGEGVAPEAGKLQLAIALLAGRNSLLASLVQRGAPIEAATCVSHAFVKLPVFVNALYRDASELSEAEVQEIQETTLALMQQCSATAN